MHRVLCAVLVFGTACAASARPVVGGFSAARGGSFSLRDGDALSVMRSDITLFPGVTLAAADTLTPSYLAGIDVLVISSATGGNSAITPLTPDEQAALVDFIRAGHSALLFVDNDSFAGGGTPAVNASVISPLGLSVTGTGAPWARRATVTDPFSSGVTSGPNAIVESYFVGWSGWFDNLGPATALATLDDNGQPSLALIPRHQLAPAAGLAVCFSDSTMIADGYITAGTQGLILDAMHYALYPCAADVNGDGVTNIRDFLAFLQYYAAGDPRADLTADGEINVRDFLAFLQSYSLGCNG
jgi:hypothetical protein